MPIKLEQLEILIDQYKQENAEGGPPEYGGDIPQDLPPPYTPYTPREGRSDDELPPYRP